MTLPPLSPHLLKPGGVCVGVFIVTFLSVTALALSESVDANLHSHVDVGMDLETERRGGIHGRRRAASEPRQTYFSPSGCPSSGGVGPLSCGGGPPSCGGSSDGGHSQISKDTVIENQVLHTS